MENNIPSSTKYLKIIVKPIMTSKLEKIAEREGISPVALVLLQVARFINEKENEYQNNSR